MENNLVYVLDFGDTNVVSEDPMQIIEWIKTDVFDLKSGDELHYTITTQMMTQAEIDALPEWQ